jgi:serine/threonine protein kinase/ABC-type branched-subunit amino acid transport system substrate-binding protein
MAAVEPSTFLLAGKYRLIAEIGRGGMADVYLAATQAGMGGFQKLVVVKVLRQGEGQEDDEVVRMFLDEARLSARLNHPNVVQTNEVGEDAGRYYLVMEYLEGQTMERIVRRSEAGQRFSLPMRLHAFVQVLAGLHYAHELTDYDGKLLGVVHRDVSPSNIFVTYDGRAKLVDFGIAKAVNSAHKTQVGMLKGKMQYMAPEQFTQVSPVDRRTDVYAAGIVLWELLAGSRMWKGVKSIDSMRRVVAGDLPSLRAAAPKVPVQLEQICSRALAHSPADRYPTAEALEADIEAYLAAHPPRATDREIGTKLKEMFGSDRARVRAAVEAQLSGPAPDETHLPSIPIELGAFGGSTSSFGSDSSAGSRPRSESAVSRPSDVPAQATTPPVSKVASSVSSPVVQTNVRPTSEKGQADTLLSRVLSKVVTKKPRGTTSARTMKLALAVAFVAVPMLWLWGSTRRPSATEAPGRAAAAVEPTGTAPTASAAVTLAHRVRGVTNDEVLCGMSAPFSGPSRELGNRMKLGVETAFSVINDQGGLSGRTLRLVALDDGYEGVRAGENMKELIDKRGVFAVIGNVGTPTAKVAAPYAVASKTMFFGALTGAKILRQEPPDRYVFNFRASYEEETAKMVRYLVDAKKVSPSSIVVFAQHDGYGDAGFDGVAKTIRKYGRGDSDVLRVNYERNTVDIDDAVRDVVRYDFVHRVAAVVMVSTYKAAARFIQKIKDRGLNPMFLNVSFVDSNALLEELKELGPGYAPGVVVTQVVPHYESGGTGVLRYREALNRYHPDQRPDFVSLEGYVVGTLFAEGVRRAGRDLDTERLVDSLESVREYDMGIGAILNFGMSEHQGSHKVWGTVIDANGHFQTLDME